MICLFDTELAAAIGVNESILLVNIAYWVNHNRQNERNEHDGKYWTYNSIKAYQEQFPCWSDWQIRNILKNLEASGYILSRSDLNENPMARTKWYTLTDTGERLTQKFRDTNSKKHSGDSTNASEENCNLHLLDSTNASAGKHKSTIYTKEYVHKNTKVKAKTQNPPFAHPSDELVEAWNGFVEMRKELKKPLTVRAKKLIASKLEKLAPGDDAQKAAILDQSVEHSWQGVFPLKGEGRAGSRPQGRQQTAEELYEETLAKMEEGGLL